jgi:hypothetical protein
MSKHLHDIGMPWPFIDADNTAVFSCRHVIEEDHAILRVSHDEDDGAWQFLCGQPHIQEDARLVCLGCVVLRDKTLTALADLPLGWSADRDGPGLSWVREVNPPMVDDEDDG